MTFPRPWVVLIVALLAPGVAAAGYLELGGVVRVVEGDSGHVDVDVPWTLTEAAATEVSFTFSTRDGTAQAPADYQAVAGTRVNVPPGTTAGSVVVRIFGDTDIEADEGLNLQFDDITGAENTGTSAVLVIEGDDVDPLRRLAARDDHVDVVVNQWASIYPEQNDSYDLAQWNDVRVELVAPPVHGTVLVSEPPEWSPGVASFLYEAPDDYLGRDDFTYRLCSDEGGGCSQAKVVIHVRPHLRKYLFGGRSGRDVLDLHSQPPSTTALYSATPLVAPRRHAFVMTADPTPHDPWDTDAGLDWVTVVVPATPDGAAVEHRILVERVNHLAHDAYDGLFAYAGVDNDGDGRPSLQEQACVSALMRCEMALTAGPAPVSYWVALHAASGSGKAAVVDVYDVPVTRGDGTLTVSGPPAVAPAERALVRLSWQDDGFTGDDTRAGLVRFGYDGTTPAGDFPVVLYAEDRETPMPLLSGVARTIDLLPGHDERRVFIDVPSGATRLAISSRSAQDVDLYVTRERYASDADSSEVTFAAGEETAIVSLHAPDGNHDLVVQGPALTPGRWYLVPANPGTARASVALSATLEAVGPVIRPGSYFNPARSGSGLVLYPAADQWAGLWYTYYDEREPTWYYLQAPAPGADGIWRSPVYRAAWHGTQARHTMVGQAIVTPVGPDQFTFTYTLEGQVGSEPYVALGRGCPMSGGVALDISSHWFDPARAGNGYSVQMWPDYEFFAAFVYDRQGMPQFLAAENPAFGGAESDLVLQRLRGACPTCDYLAPDRGDVGFLTRRLAGGALGEITMDVDHDGSAWTVTDRVQTLGGPGTTQGCDP